MNPGLLCHIKVCAMSCAMADWMCCFTGEPLIWITPLKDIIQF